MNKRLKAFFALPAVLALAVFAAGEAGPPAFYNLAPKAVEALSAPAACGDEEKSGPAAVLPWESDEAFLARQAEAGAPVRMGAYRAVLIDPLPGEEYNVHLAARMLQGIVVQPGHTFSQNRSIGPYTEDRGFRIGPTYIGTTLTKTIGGGVCKIASTLYNVTVLSDLAVVERHCHSMPVPYVPYGQDATVSYGARDFKFRNNTPSPVMIWAEGIDNKLYVAFYGSAQPPKVEWSHDKYDVRKAQTTYKKNPDLPHGFERIVLEGMDGATVKSKVTVTYADGTIAVKDMGVSFYHSMPFLVERGD